VTGISTPEYRKIAEEVKTATPDSRSRQTRQNIFLSAPPPTRRSNSDPHRDASAPRVVFCGKYDNGDGGPTRSPELRSHASCHHNALSFWPRLKQGGWAADTSPVGKLEGSAAMTGIQISVEEFVRWLEPPTLRMQALEVLSEEEVERLLVRRFRAFSGRGLSWQHALLLTVTPDSGG
jgi:hypothetical protein